MSRSSRPQTPSISSKEANTCGEVSTDLINHVIKDMTADGNEQTPCTSLTELKRKQHNLEKIVSQKTNKS